MVKFVPQMFWKILSCFALLLLCHGVSNLLEMCLPRLLKSVLKSYELSAIITQCPCQLIFLCQWLIGDIVWVKAEHNEWRKKKTLDTINHKVCYKYIFIRLSVYTKSHHRLTDKTNWIKICTSLWEAENRLIIFPKESAMFGSSPKGQKQVNCHFYLSFIQFIF